MMVRIVLAYFYFAVVVGIRRLFKGPRRPGWPRRFETVLELIHWLVKRWIGLDVVRIRAELAGLKSLPIPALQRVTSRPVEIEGLRAVLITPKQSRARPVILYLHGGAYVFCSVETHRHLMTRLALASDARVLGVDYRLAPEHPFPMPLQDAVAAYRWLLSQGESPRQIVIAGDSAGGGLALATLLFLRDAGEPLPAGGILISPWVDLTTRDRSLDSNLDYDYVAEFTSALHTCAKGYAGEEKLDHPLISPIGADHRGLPPLLIQVGGAEMLHDQVQRLAEKVRGDGVETRLEVGPDMVHVWHAFADVLPQARIAIRTAGAFVKEKTAEERHAGTGG